MTPIRDGGSSGIVTPEALKLELQALERRLTLKMGALVLIAVGAMAVLDVVV